MDVGTGLRVVRFTSRQTLGNLTAHLRRLWLQGASVRSMPGNNSRGVDRHRIYASFDQAALNKLARRHVNPGGPLTVVLAVAADFQLDRSRIRHGLGLALGQETQPLHVVEFPGIQLYTDRLIVSVGVGAPATMFFAAVRLLQLQWSRHGQSAFTPAQHPHTIATGTMLRARSCMHKSLPQHESCPRLSYSYPLSTLSSLTLLCIYPLSLSLSSLSTDLSLSLSTLPPLPLALIATDAHA